MSDWRYAVEKAVSRAQEKDLGAVAAVQGIWGLPLTVSGKKAERVYFTASECRRKHNDSLARRHKPLTPPGTTGFDDLDAELGKVDLAQAV